MCICRIITLIGYEPSEVIGRTAYQFHNPLDAERVRSCHSNCMYIMCVLSKKKICTACCPHNPQLNYYVLFFSMQFSFRLLVSHEKVVFSKECLAKMLGVFFHSMQFSFRLLASHTKVVFCKDFSIKMFKFFSSMLFCFRLHW